MLKLLLLTLSVLLVTACGFSPIYYQSSDNNSPTALAMNNVEINNIADHEGQMLRNHLIDHMYHNGRPQHATTILKVGLKATTADLGEQKDATTTRSEYTLEASFALIDKTTSKEIFHDTARSVVSYSKLDAQYGTLASKENAAERAVNEVGQQIITRVSVYFATKDQAKQETAAEP